MEIKIDESEIIFNQTKSHKGAELIGAKNGAKNGFCFGLSYYHAEEFGYPGIHDDQEGFYVIEGRGKAKIGNEVFDIYPGISFIAHAGVEHELIKNHDSKPVKVIWTHGAI
jgi:mannose-6-phosphate isomerase-like protein (cupin superfamily)